MITVRLATMDDADAIARETSRIQELHNEALPLMFKAPSAELFPPRKLAALIRESNSIVAIAEVDGKIVGHIYGGIVSRAEDEFSHAHSCICIHQIGVDEEFRRKGVGAALMAFIRDRARTLGLTALQVDHWTFNTRAAAFFDACGFSPVKIVMRQAL
jgi:GNAT superfamily N-acetyltransferase